ncbi:MAG: hypothetical protein MJY93_02910 [Fibrobacter sp.]|nr:hypothetical protein [Fibrobacter sp.]
MVVFAKLLVMILRYLKYLMIALVLGFFAACSDDSDEAEFLFDREVTELSVIRSCADGADSGAYCFQVRFHYPIDTEKLTSIYVWVDSTVVGDTAKAVNKDKLKKADAVIEYQKGTSANYETVDVTPYIQDYVKERDSLLVAIYCDYSDDERPGTVQRVYLHFGDDMAPSLVSLTDSMWTTGAKFQWNRPADQTDYYDNVNMSGQIIGYNIVIYALNEEEDIRDLKVKVSNSEETDSTGSSIYERHKRIHHNNDSVWVQDVEHGSGSKNYLRLVVHDGKGYDVDDFDANAFTLVVEGLRAESRYTIGISSWDSVGNSSGNERTNSVLNNQLFITTDSIAPLMPTAIFTLKDSLNPELARLDSNNRVRIFWSRSVDPLIKKHGIVVDSVLTIPDSCRYSLSLRDYECMNEDIYGYYVDYYDKASKDWVSYTYAGGKNERFQVLYKVSGDTMVADPEGSFVTDTIRWVAPGDTLIIRIRAKDTTGYYSKALVDTIVVAPSPLSAEVECPEGFVVVSVGDTSVFCMERYEHMDDSGKFVSNVLYSEAVAACEAMEVSGFTVSLCGESDWEKVCLSGGTLSYGVIEETDSTTSDYLFSNCNVATNDSVPAFDLSKRSSRCLSPAGVHDMPGQFQEWVVGRSEDTAAVVKGGSYKKFGGLDRETQALCTNRSFPYYTRRGYTKDTVYLYREGTKVDTVYVKDTTRTLYATIPSFGKKDPLQLSFKDTLQFFTVKDSSGNELGMDYAPYGEYKKGGDEWLETLANGLVYEPDHIEVVFMKKEKVAYREAAAFYKSSAIGFRCCAYK